MFEHYQLKNKANVILVPQHDTQSVTVLVMFPIGSRYETEKMSGSSHFIEHLMFKGTEKRKNTLVLTREIDRLGAEYNAFTAKEYTGYYIKVDHAFTETALDISSDMLFNSKFDPKEIDRERTVVIEELRMYDDNPMMSIDSLFEKLLYAGTPLGRDIGGTAKHLMSFKREDIIRYRDEHYQPSNMTVVVAGNIVPETRAWIEKYFGEQKDKTKVKQTYLPAAFGTNKKSERIVVKKKVTDQAQLTLGFPGFSYQAKENYILDVMNTILGGSMSSRLFIQVRERKGLAYMIRSGIDNFRDTGHVFIRAGLDAKKINQAIVIIKSEIEKLIKTPVTQRELKDAKTHIRGRMALSMEDSSTQSSWYANELLFMDKIKTPEERLQKIDQVTAAQIQVMAKKVFRMNEMRVAIIGDVEKEKIIF